MNVYHMYLRRVKRNFHLLTSMSPMKNKFAERIRKFPYFTNSCTIIWMTEWPDEALRSVAKAMIVDARKQVLPEEFAPAFVEIFIKI
jgi:dynein heavy chain